MFVANTETERMSYILEHKNGLLIKLNVVKQLVNFLLHKFYNLTKSVTSLFIKKIPREQTFLCKFEQDFLKKPKFSADGETSRFYLLDVSKTKDPGGV